MSPAAADVQLRIWGYADVGQRDIGAQAAETHPDGSPDGHVWRWAPLWDTPAVMETTLVTDPDGTWRPPPMWHALPWVAEHKRRTENA